MAERPFFQFKSTVSQVVLMLGDAAKKDRLTIKTIL